MKNISATIIFAAGCVLFFILDLNQYDAASEIRSALKERQVLLDERTAERDNFKSLNDQVKSRKSDADRLALMLPETKQIDQIVSAVDASSRNAGLILKSFSATDSSDTTQTSYKRTLITLDLSGTYTSFISFLKDIENNLRLNDIFDLTVSHDPNTTGGLIFGLKIYAYSLSKP